MSETRACEACYKSSVTACRPMRRSREGTTHPGRNGQFEYIRAQADTFLAANEPVISVDTKKKEPVGDFKNDGREYPKGRPERAQVHDFIDPELGKAIPYGIYDISRDEGWVTVGIDHDCSTSNPDRQEAMAGSSAATQRRIRLYANGLMRNAASLAAKDEVETLPIPKPFFNSAMSGSIPARGFRCRARWCGWRSRGSTPLARRSRRRRRCEP